MFDMMKKLRQAQEEMKQIKARLDTITVEGNAAEGKVSVIATGNRHIKKININDQSLLQDREALEKCITDAVNDALRKADSVNETEMKAAAGAMMPGLGSMIK